MSQLNLPALERAASESRGLSMDAVAKAASGHLGLPLGATEIGAVLFGQALNYNPDDTHWLNRDIFVLSAGHGSMFLYSWLHLAGYDISLEDVKNFRQLNSKTPGHPEFHDTPGVEATTGPLGQGIGNAVGYASSAKMAAARFNTEQHKIFDNHVVVLAGDGCLQEGIAQEALSFAGHHRLDNLILFYDSNDVTLDAMAIETQSEDAVKRFESLGFDAQVVVNGNSITDLYQAFLNAKNSKTNKPQAIICKTLIAKSIPEVAGTNKGHGEAGVKFVDAARKALGLPEEKFFVSQETRHYFADHKKTLLEKYNQWTQTYAQWKSANPQLAQLLESRNVEHNPSEVFAKIPEFNPKESIATRKAGSEVLQPIAQALPLVVSGSADLHGSTLNYIKEGRDFTPSCPGGRNIKFGIREHAMGAMLNGFAYHGIFRASGATFLVFSDYCRPSIRLAALSHLPVTYIFTHDSIGVGEDGPTHQPVETVSGLRMIPNLDVIRPADPEETAGAFASAFTRMSGPTLLALTRQNLPNLTMVDVKVRREGVLKGAYILIKETGALKQILIATGSEVQHAVEAAKQLGDGVRVVSMPCTEIFDRQSSEYKEQVLPSSCRNRVAIEAGVTSFWWKYVGLDGKVIGIDRFGGNDLILILFFIKLIDQFI
ncbi:transketolase [Heterostelium album PN500]|uniref:Transketolase n=1 Tax=Heterostelium pallidum (strain ATCC 26659 / Pp 5 / PN500) TaxID=670386 RepID=D3BUD8_HETP5|nr:transketolase [Heterostelium album PN500]EFA74726.1 transketolase [Heterostelium album PN500]|eukprot:XP_020426860.1 transketolase [Heterostelium album PN500]